MNLKLTGPRGEEATVEAAIHTPEFSDRLFKGAKLGLILFAVTLGTAFIPILHFVTVPVGLLVSGFLIFKGLTKSKEVKVSSFECPCCEATTQEQTMVVTGEQFYLNCSKCNVLLKAFGQC